MDVFVSLLALLGLCLFFVGPGRVKGGAAPFLAVSCAMLWFTLFGMLGLLALGGWLFYGLCAGLGGLALWRGRGGLIKRLATPGFLLFCGLSLVLLVYFSLRQPLFTGWDEYSFWGVATKITKLNNTLYPLAPHGFWWTMTEHPGLIVFSYFAQFFGSFAPWKMYWAYGVLYVACVAALLAPFGRRHWRIAVPLAVCGLLVPFFFSVPYQTVQMATTWLSVYGDLPGGLLFGGCLCLYFGVRQGRGGLWQVLPPLAALALVKENIMPVALVAAGVFSVDCLVFGTGAGGLAARPRGGKRPARDAAPPWDTQQTERHQNTIAVQGVPAASARKRGLPEAPRRLLWCAAFFASVLVPYLAWKRYALWANTFNPFLNGAQTEAPQGAGLVQALRELLGLAPKSEAYVRILGELVNSFLGRVPVAGGYQNGIVRVGMAGTGLTTLLFIVAVFAAAVLLAKTARRRGRMALAGGLLLGGFAAYHLMLLVVYAFLSHDKAQGIFDYARYTASFTAGWCMLGLLFLGLAARWRGGGAGLVAPPGWNAVIPGPNLAVSGQNAVTAVRRGGNGAARRLVAHSAVLLLAVLMLARTAHMVRPGYSVLDFPANTFAVQRAQQRQAQAVARHIQPGSRVFFVSQQSDDGGEYFIWHFHLQPIVVAYSITGGWPLRPPLEGEDESYLNVASLEKLTRYLADNHCDYILIDSIDAGFVQNYGAVFSDLSPTDTPALYRLQPGGLYARVALE